jgi:hypothetical protein
MTNKSMNASGIVNTRTCDAWRSGVFPSPFSITWMAAPNLKLLFLKNVELFVTSPFAREGARGEALARENSRISRRNLEFAFRNKEIVSRLPGKALVTN